MNRELFGTDGIRGVAGEWPLDPEGAEQIGRAVGVHFASAGESVMLGYDTRQSSPWLAESLTAGITAVGVDVEHVGVVPTPGLAHATGRSAAKAGVMITASHNPHQDNGIKVFSAEGNKLSDDTEAELNGLVMAAIANRGRRGRLVAAEHRVNDYRRFVVGTLGNEDLGGTYYALDAAHGATSDVAGRIFRAAGSKIATHFSTPNGQNINERCGATYMQPLQDIVRYSGYEGGFAFDGDGDRLMVVDEKGRTMDGDHILYALAKARDHKTVVATQMSNMGLEKALTAEGRTLHRTDVGDRYVLAGMQDTGATLGGEQSGHIILAEHLQTGDGIIAALAFALAAKKAGKSFAALRDELVLFPQTMVNINTPHKGLAGHDTVRFCVAMHSDELGSDGRVNVRASGTQEQIRVMVEAADAEERAPAIAEDIRRLIYQLT